MAGFITPKNWREFQHYKDRNPPWIRLHKALLDNYEWHKLPTASKALAPMLWLMASDALDGQIDADPEKIAFRLRMSPQDVVDGLGPLISLGFFISIGGASEALAECQQLAAKSCSETEALQRQRQRQSTEAETERDTSRKGDKRPLNSAVSDALSDGVDATHLNDWIKARKSPLTATAWEGLKTEAEKAGITPAEAVRICAVKGWRGFDSTWNWRSASQGTPASAADQRDAEAMKLLGFGQGDFIDA